VGLINKDKEELVVENWFQILQDELQRYDDELLSHWPIEWWKQLLREGMNPAQAVRYTTRVMHRREHRQFNSPALPPR
jgi:hypothetical protein